MAWRTVLITVFIVGVGIALISDIISTIREK